MTHYRCRKCSNYLFTEDSIITEHGQKDEVCPATNNSLVTQWFLNYESERTPKWISETIREGFWSIKGRLCCPRCLGRIGSFDLAARKLCPCQQFTLPAVHVLCCRVDKITEAGLQDVAALGQRMVMPQRRDNSVPGQSSFVVGTNTPNPFVVGTNTPNPFVVGTNTPNPFVVGTNTPNPFVVGTNTPNPDIAGMDSADFISNADRAITNISHQNSENFSRERESESEEMLIPRRRHRRHKRRKLLLPEELEVLRLPVYKNKFEVLEQEVVEKNEEENEEEAVKNTVHNKEAGVENFDMSVWDFSVESSVSEDHCCAICLDLYCRPMTCHPCNHKYCEPCLRRLARPNRYHTQCPMCRAVITRCVADRDLEIHIKDLYPGHYMQRFKKEQKICSKLPLPTTNRRASQRRPLNHGENTRSHMICLALMLSIAILIICAFLGMLYAVFKVLRNVIYFLMYFLDYFQVLHDILQIF